jgi:HAD superfamily hydrolase (TIGR01509 family)
MSHTATLQAIIFDVDGTLADTEEVHRQSFNEAFAEFDLDWNWSQDDYIDLLAISGGRERIRAYAQSHLTPNPRIGAARELAASIHTRKSAIYRDKLNSGQVQLRPGVQRLLNEAYADGLHLAIATSTSTANVETLLGNNLDKPLTHYFETIVTSDIVVDKKPAPAVYQYALAELGLAPDHCIAIEDTLNGNLAALAAGLKTVITTHRFTRHHDFPGASLVLDQLGERNRPFSILSGDAHGSSYVDVPLLDTILTGSNHFHEDPFLQQDNTPLVMAK